MLLEREIAETRSLEHCGIKILAPSGEWVNVTHVCRTIPLPVWKVTTRSHTLECAHKHIVIAVGGPVAADQLAPGVLLVTTSGVEEVVSAAFTGRVEELYDLRVDSQDHLYFTNGIASHNSTGIGLSELTKLNLVPNYKSLYIAPLRDHVKTMADRLMEMQRASVFPPEYVLRHGLRNNLYYKESPLGGSLKLLHVLTDATRVRGTTSMACVFDEAQDFDSEHLPEILQVQRSYEGLGITVFAGTSKDLDTCLEAQYQAGSRGVWHVRCGCPEKYHSLHDAERLPAMMSVVGIVCPNTGRALDIENGLFVHESPVMFQARRVSFHLPQIIVPTYARGRHFAKVWSDFKEYPYKKFLREVMGIAVDAGMTELTEDDLRRCCSNDTFAQIQQEYLAGKRRYAYVFSGCDWGGSDWEPATKTKQSYTVHSMYGLRADGKMELIHAARYAGMNYREIAGSIVDTHNKLKGFAFGADNGGGSYYNAYLRDCGKIPSQRVLVFNYTDTKLLLDRIDHPEIQLLSLHRSDSISALITDIKDQNIVFPRWDESRGFLLDCLNIRRNITEIPSSGRSIMRYIRHGSKADDFLHSTNYAVMLKRVVTKEPLVPNKQILTELSVALGLAPVEVNMERLLATSGGYFAG
jgi:hypothetical protein